MDVGFNTVCLLHRIHQGRLEVWLEARINCISLHQVRHWINANARGEVAVAWMTLKAPDIRVIVLLHTTEISAKQVYNYHDSLEMAIITVSGVYKICIAFQIGLKYFNVYNSPCVNSHS